MAGPNDERDRLERKLGQLLIEAREAAGLNQTRLGKAVGRSQSFVSNYERAQRRLGIAGASYVGIAGASYVPATCLAPILRGAERP